MYDDNYCREPREIPLVAFYKRVSASEEKEKIYTFTDAHYHRDTEFILIESGRGEFYVDGQKYLFSPGSIFLINSYELHYAVAETEHELAYYCIDFDMKMLLGADSFDIVEKYAQGERKLKHFCPDSRGIAEGIEKICRAYERDLAGWMLEAKGYLFLIFAEIERENLFCAAEEHSMFARKIYDYVEQEHAGSITSRDAAVQLKYNHSYFCRMFKSHFGMNFGKFLNGYRIRQARHMMENGAAKISDIALAAGFNSISYFSECFRQITGVTPTQYLKLCKR